LSQQNEEIVVAVVFDSELVDRELGWRIGKLGVYHRLSVDKELDSGCIPSPNPIGNLVASTKNFLLHHNSIDKVDQCVGASERLGRVTLKELCEFLVGQAI
jgi:hypothetical protein